MAQCYARPLEEAGALPLHLPYLADFADAVELADGILMGFGGDIHPARYGGDAAHPTLTNVSEARDAFEFGLAGAALASGKPVLGICRGMQVINVARGGSMHADAGDAPGRGLGPLGARPRVRAHRQRAPGPPRPRAAGGAGLAARRRRSGPGRTA